MSDYNLAIVAVLVIALIVVLAVLVASFER